MLIRKISVCLTILGVSLHSMAKDIPIAIDSRIKTYVYNENEVFRITVNYGYQTSLEFAEGEEIQTISVGNNYLWQLTPIGKRLFIKPLEDNISTNMTILSNKRSYQFELQSKSAINSFDEDLAYVIKFFYPNEEADNKALADSIAPAVPISSMPTSNYSYQINPFNFEYTQEGANSIAPLKVFDDGQNTFLKFPSNMQGYPSIYDISGDARVLLEPRKKGEYVIVNTVGSKLELISGDKKVTIFNEAKLERSQQ